MSKNTTKGKDPAAVSLGRRGGSVSGIAKGIATLSDEERSAMASTGAAVRWAEYYAKHPDKLKAKKARDRKRAKAAK